MRVIDIAFASASASSPRDVPSRNVSDVRFLLWTRRVRPDTEPQSLPFGDPDSVARRSDFDARRPGGTALLVHGYDDGPETRWIREMARELLKKGKW